MIGQGELKIGTDVAYDMIFSFYIGRLAVADPGQKGQRTCMNLMRRLLQYIECRNDFYGLNGFDSG